MKAIPCAIGLAPLLMGCGEPDAAEIPGPMLQITSADAHAETLELCVDPKRLRARPILVTADITVHAMRVDAGNDTVLLGVKRTPSSAGFGDGDQSAFARIDDESELHMAWQAEVVSDCEEHEIRFRMLDRPSGPSDAVIDIEWFVSAKIEDDRRAEISLEIRDP